MKAQTTTKDTISQLKIAKEASKSLARSSNKERNEALVLISKELLQSRNEILKANEKDIEIGKNNNLSSALLDRLLLNEKRLQVMALSVQKVASQEDPLGKIQASWKHPKGMTITKITVPLGVVCLI